MRITRGAVLVGLAAFVGLTACGAPAPPTQTSAERESSSRAAVDDRFVVVARQPVGQSTFYVIRDNATGGCLYYAIIVSTATMMNAPEAACRASR